MTTFLLALKLFIEPNVCRSVGLAIKMCVYIHGDTLMKGDSSVNDSLCCF